VQDGPVDRLVTHAVSLGIALGGGQHGAVVIKKFKE
jgi:hypothetical protein